MAWEYLRTFKQQHDLEFTFTIEIRENGIAVETRDFSVTYDPAQGVAAAAQALHAAICNFIKVILIARSTQVQTPTVVAVAPGDLT